MLFCILSVAVSPQMPGMTAHVTIDTRRERSFSDILGSLGAVANPRAFLSKQSSAKTD